LREESRHRERSESLERSRDTGSAVGLERGVESQAAQPPAVTSRAPARPRSWQGRWKAVTLAHRGAVTGAVRVVRKYRP
jgi:hypothetical protein